MADDEVSLRPLSLRPGGKGKSANPFAGFGKGAGFAVKKQAQQRAIEDEKPPKPPGEVIRYDREFLLTFAERSYSPPEEITNPANAELLIDDVLPQAPDSQRVVAPEVPDSRDWRARTALPAQPEANSRPFQEDRTRPTSQASAVPAIPATTQQQQQPQQQQQQQQQQQRQRPSAQAQASGTQAPSQAPAGPAPQIQRAADVGRQAWAPSTSGTSDYAKAVKSVKGTLNKLTPEKFERLLQQLVDVVKSAELLHATISLVFESAVAQPTFVAMYADLCDRLSKQLPEFPPAEGETRPMGFKRVLLNTCQEEFEGAAAARQATEQVAEEQKEATARTAKMRTLGNIRLIAELFKKSVVPEKIVLVCVQDLMGDPKQEPSENNVEAICELLTVAGKTLDAASAQSKQRTTAYFSTLDKYMNSKSLPSRTRFMVRDLVELRRSNWIPRRAALQAKTIEEIHAEAHAELGMMPATIIPALESLAALPRQTAAEVELFPSFKGGEDWQSMIKKSSSQPGFSALTGEWKPVEEVQQPSKAAPAAPAAPATQDTAAPASNGAKPPTEEQRELRCQNLFTEYLSTTDIDEAVLTAQEIVTPEFVPRLIQAGVDKLFEVTRDKDQDLLIKVLVALQTRGALPSGSLLTGISKFTSQLEDLRLDIPKAPLLLGNLLGQAVSEQVADGGALQKLCEPIEDTEARRELISNVLKFVQTKDGQDSAKTFGTSESLQLADILKGNPEFDAHLDSVKDYMKKQKLDFIAVS